MNEQKKNRPEETDEIGNDLETGNEVNTAIEQQGDDAAAGIPRDTDAAKHQKKPDEAADDKRKFKEAP
jgi:hypothetical protein